MLTVPVREACASFHTFVLRDESRLHMRIIQRMHPISMLAVYLQPEIVFQQLSCHLNNPWVSYCACTVW
jgi:hypothetical protein